MVSTFSWLDYSEHERRKMLDVIELFGEKTTRDEIGLGGIRDAFADLLFPGTSTIQTRAKYFLFVAWMYQGLERKRISSRDIADRSRKEEILLLRSLLQSDDLSGLIGRQAKENVIRLPSSVYWQGLNSWGLRNFRGSQDEYHRSLDLHYLRKRGRHSARSEAESEAADHPEPDNWHSGLPDPPAGFPLGAAFTLALDEAAYLRERVLTIHPQTLLAHVLRERMDVEAYPFAWDLAAEIPGHLQHIVIHGQNFSEVMYGAQLLYNLMLAELRGNEEWITEYREEMRRWDEMLTARQTALQQWNRQEFWQIVLRQNPRVHQKAQSFVNHWCELALGTTSPASLSEDQSARQLIEHREFQLKGRLARLKDQRARELWSGAAGAAQLDLRWTSARRIVADILSGLEAEVHA